MTEKAILTPYAAAKIVNEQLEKAGVDKKVPPQMLYNYTTGRLNAGKTPLIAFALETGVDRKDLDKWTKTYVAKCVAASQPKVEEDELQLTIDDALVTDEA